VWERFATAIKIDRIPFFDVGRWAFNVRPARNALETLWGKFNQLIYRSMIRLTQCTMHGRRVFISFFFRFDWKLADIGGAVT